MVKPQATGLPELENFTIIMALSLEYLKTEVHWKNHDASVKPCVPVH